MSVKQTREAHVSRPMKDVTGSYGRCLQIVYIVPGSGCSQAGWRPLQTVWSSVDKSLSHDEVRDSGRMTEEC